MNHRPTRRCEERKLITETPNGPRVALGALWASFSPEERRAWDRYAGQATCDDFGIPPEAVEKFLQSTETAT